MSVPVSAVTPTNILVPDSLGRAEINPDALAHVYTYNGDGTLATDTITDGVGTWVKTFTYTTGNLTGESAWVKQ
jgi:hypothetical protein